MSDFGLAMKDAPGQGDGNGGRGHKKRGGPAAAVAVLAVVALVAVGVFAVLKVLDGRRAPDYPGPGSGEVVVVVKPGDSVTAIGGSLLDKDVVASTQAFVDAAAQDPRATSIAPGSYLMLEQMSAQGALDRILDPASRYQDVLSLPEGLRLDETIGRTAKATGIDTKALWRVASSPDTLELPGWADGTGALRAEGFMFPATYELQKSAKAEQVLQTYVDRFDQAAEEEGITSAPAKVGVTPYEALIVASLVQAEGQPEDYAKIARVIYNRLDPQTWGGTYGKLQIDATLNYALAEKNVVLTTDELNDDGPYNTYTRTGLPPTPINSPGQEAIAAALNPADGDWLYYVSVNLDTGETKFTADYDQFLKYKAELERWLEEN